MGRKFKAGQNVIVVRRLKAENDDLDYPKPSTVGTRLRITGYIDEDTKFRWMCSDGVGYAAEELEAE